jgi:hypothetical protein
MGPVAVGPAGQVPHRACVAGSKSYYTVVVEDVAASKIVATATLLVEVLVVPARMPCRVLVEGCTPLSSVLIAIERPFRPSHARRVMPRTCAGTCWQYKFLRGGHLAGHIEDVVVDASQRYVCCLDLLVFDNVRPWGEFGGLRALDTRINALAPPGAFTSHTFGTYMPPNSCMHARGKKLGFKLIQALQRLGGLLGCYKVILDCSEDNVKFYTRCGFKQKEVQMVVYIQGNEQPRPRL